MNPYASHYANHYVTVGQIPGSEPEAIVRERQALLRGMMFGLLIGAAVSAAGIYAYARAT